MDHTFDIFDCHHHVGDVKAFLGETMGGYKDSADDPRNAEMQRRIEIMDEGGVRQACVIPGHGYERPNGIVDTRRINNDIAAYRDALAIAERLAAADPGNAEWQRDLIVSCVKLSEAAPAEAAAWLTRALGVARTLAQEGRLAPVDAWMPGELQSRLRAAAGAPGRAARPRGKG